MISPEIALERKFGKVVGGFRFSKTISLLIIYFILFFHRGETNCRKSERVRERESETVIFISKEKYIFIYFNELNKRRKCF